MPPRPELLEGDRKGEGETVDVSKNNNYGAIQHDDRDIERVPLTRMSLSDDSLEYKNEHRNQNNKSMCPSAMKMKRLLKPLAIILVGTILSCVLYIVTSKNRNNEPLHIHHPEKNSQNAGHHFLNDDAKMNPFLLHPVRDLGMISVDRSQTDASPSSIWSQRGEDWQPLPTNSWYLVCQN
jgi:hypothetical protein